MMSNHSRLGTLRLTMKRAKKMEATFGPLAKALRRKRQATVNRKKWRGGKLEANTMKKDRKVGPMTKPQDRRSEPNTDGEGETSYGLKTDPDREISVVIAAVNPDSIVPGAANRTMARGFRATKDVTVPAYQEVRVDLNGQVRLTSNHCLFILLRTDLAKN